MGWDDNNSGPWGGGGRRGPSSQPPKNDDIDELLRKGQERLKGMFPPGGGSPTSSPKFILFSVIVVVLLWMATGFYKVDTAEEGVILRFGEYHRTTGPGLNYHLPYPFEKVIKLEVTTINKEEIGYRSLASRGRDMQMRDVPEESLMLTGDENIVDVFFEVQWKVNDAEAFVFNIRDLRGESTVKSAAESAMREVIGNTPIASALAEGRSVIEERAKTLLQSVLDSYEAGISVVRLQLLKVDPPAKVIDAFRDVQTARADKEREINQAQAYRNDLVPKARGEAKKIVLDAEGFKESVIKRAEGEGQRFVSVYDKYKDAKEVTRKRMYLETMEDVYGGINKVMIDKSASSVVPYLPLPELQKNKKSAE